MGTQSYIMLLSYAAAFGRGTFLIISNTYEKLISFLFHGENFRKKLYLGSLLITKGERRHVIWARKERKKGKRK